MKYASYALVIIYTLIVASGSFFAVRFAAQGDNNPEHIQRFVEYVKR
jgi:hypothetical protein